MSKSVENVKRRIHEEVVEMFESSEAAGVAGKPSPEFLRNNFFELGFLDGYDEVETYWVNKPFGFIVVTHDTENGIRRYYTAEPVLDDFESYVREDLEAALRDTLRGVRAEDGDNEDLFTEVVEEVFADHAEPIDSGTLQKIQYYLRRDFLGYGKIDPIMRDHAVEDISCNGHDTPVFVYHRDYRDLRTNLTFEEDELDSLTVSLAQRGGRHLSVSNPSISTTFPDGSRAQLTLGSDIGMRGSNFTVRKFAKEAFTPVDLVASNTFSLRQMAFLWLCLEHRKSIIFAGPTASGKTTSMNAVSFFLPPDSKVVSIEEVPEVSIPHKNWVSEITRESDAPGSKEVGMYDLLEAALHKRPEYLLVGEIRTKPEVVRTFFHSIFTGHPGATTFHADSVDGAINRFLSDPLSVSERLIDSIDLISIQAQVVIGDRKIRRNRNINEVYIPDDSEGSIETQKIFDWDHGTDSFESVTNIAKSSRVLGEIAEDMGWSEDRIRDELSRRHKVLSYLVRRGITDYRDVAAILHAFSRKPDRVVRMVEEGTLARDSFSMEDV